MVTFKDAFARMVERTSDPEFVQRRRGAGYRAVGEELSRLGGRGVILYGCGTAGALMANWLKRLGVTVHGVCDSYARGVFSRDRHVIMTPEELRSKHPDATIMITTETHEREVADRLAGLGFAKEQVLPFPKLPRNPPERIAPEDFAEKHYAGYEMAYWCLADDHSRQVLLDRMETYLTGKPMSISTDSPQYFERGVVALSEGEVFVDGGAYYGETALAFAREAGKAGLSDWRVYAFEAEPEKCDCMRADLASSGNIEIVGAGLWSAEAELVFNALAFDSGSTFMHGRIGELDAGKMVVPVTSVDVFFSGRPSGDSPTFIKMDIEGAELEALEGARETLRAECPKLALSVYHSIGHPYELLRVAKECNPGYRFYLRQYMTGYTETVLYAV